MSHLLFRYRQIADQFRILIESGKLSEGSKLPSVRAIAREYGVSVLTALRVCHLLEKDLLVEARPKSGFYVSRQSADHSRKDIQFLEITPLDAQAEAHLAILGTPCRIRLDLANGETALYPVKKLGVLMRQLIYRDPSLLGNHVRGTGYPLLKQQIVQRAFEYGCNLDSRELLVTNGCIESLVLALRAVTKPGDRVVVESPVYFVILQMLRNLGLQALEVPMTGSGIDLEILEHVLEGGGVSAIISIANANNPTGITLSLEKKAALIQLAERFGATIIEDDIYGDTYFSSSRPKPLRALSDKVILCSSFSKTLAPGIRVGWIAGGRWSSMIASMKYTSTMATPIYPQAAIAEFLRSGGYDVHLRKLRRTLNDQIQKMRASILEHFLSGTQVSEPSGGYVLWVTLPNRNVCTRLLFEQARREGVGIAPGHLFSIGNQFNHCFRLNAGFGWDRAVDGAIKLLAQLVVAQD